MIVIPAIDMKEGKCVRLRQGRMDDDTVFSDDPVEMAVKFSNQGAKRLHLVDLDGAFAGEPKNARIVKEITATLPDMPVQIGGGIRNLEIANAYIEAGISWLIVGTIAVTHPEVVDELCKEFPGKVIVGLDATDGFVATEGWAKSSGDTAIDLAKRFSSSGVSSIVYTDISRDGMMNGVNAEATRDLAQAIDIPVIASGGVTELEDIKRLCGFALHGIEGAIVGRALYEGTLDLAQAQALSDSLST